MSRRMGLNKSRVIEAAAELVDDEGLEQLAPGRLAERLNIKTPSLYNHIAGLPGLRHDLALYCLRDLHNRVTRATVGKSGPDAIFALADAFRAYATQMPGRYALTSQAPPPDDPEVQAAAQQVVEVILAVLAPFKLGKEEAIHAIRGLRSIVQGFISLEIAGGFGMPVDIETSFHWLINLFIDGLSRSADDGTNLSNA
jgi:AcrR family transcriptional regulator